MKPNILIKSLGSSAIIVYWIVIHLKVELMFSISKIRDWKWLFPERRAESVPVYLWGFWHLAGCTAHRGFSMLSEMVLYGQVTFTSAVEVLFYRNPKQATLTVSSAVRFPSRSFLRFKIILKYPYFDKTLKTWSQMRLKIMIFKSRIFKIVLRFWEAHGAPTFFMASA